MKFSIDKSLILVQLKKQIESTFLIDKNELIILDKYFDATLERCDICFSMTNNKYYNKDGDTFFSPYITTQYTIFLYYYSNTIYRNEPLHILLCDKLYYLNKMLNGLDLFYMVSMPDNFMCEHPVGTVIGGSGKFGNGFLFYQNCTVGGFHIYKENKIAYPTIGDNVRMFAGSMIIGSCNIGDNVNVGARALLKNCDIPSNSTVFGQSPNLIIKPYRNETLF